MKLVRVLTKTALAGSMLAGASGCESQSPLPPPETIRRCVATDGDTLRCGKERIRLLAIDAPELPGHCRSGRACAPGDPAGSKRSLERALSSSMTIRRIGEDRYGRTLALVESGGRDLSCHQLKARQAIYKANWDNRSYVASRCPEATQR